MIRKKYGFLILGLILFFLAIFFVGCGDSKEDKKPEKNVKESQNNIEDSDCISLKPDLTNYIGMNRDEICEKFDSLEEDAVEMLGRKYYSNTNTSKGVMFFAFKDDRCISMMTDMSFAFSNYNIELNKDEISSILGGNFMDSNELEKYEEDLATENLVGIASGKFHFVIAASDQEAIKTDDLIFITEY